MVDKRTTTGCSVVAVKDAHGDMTSGVVRAVVTLLLLLTFWGQSAFAGVNALYGRHLSTKPGRGVQVDWSHPMAQGLRVLVLFNEGGGPPFMVWPQRPIASSINAPSWTANQAGIARNYSATNAYDILDTEGNLGLPTMRATVAMIRRKQDTTMRNSVSFAVDTSTDGQRLNSSLPLNDGVVYWDFGGGASPNRLTWSGYSAATNVELWTLVAGTTGSSIYLGGVSRATQPTAITRSVSTQNVTLNQWSAVAVPGDLVDLNYFGVWDAEWSAGMVAWWSADPYAFLLQPNARRWGLSIAAGGAVSPLRMLMGVGP